MIKTLAIETSCDDTSIGIVTFENGFFQVEKILAYSQVSDHLKYGGVVPEIASRLHSEKIIELLKEFEKDIQMVDFISVTSSPGLPGSLIVGTSTAEMIGTFFGKKVIAINHIFGHILSVFLERNIDDIKFPMAVLTASGGHNEIYIIENGKLKIENINPIGSVGNYYFYKIGQTLDDAAGECFDKVSRMLGGPYPGGVWVSQNASKGKPNEHVKFSRIFLKSDEYNFSFSGMKSQVYYLLKTLEEKGIPLNEQLICDICYEFQEAVVEVLSKKLLKASTLFDSPTIAITGGVSANERLFEYISALKLKKGLGAILLRPSKKLYSTDNSAMIGVVGILQYISANNINSD